MLQKVSTGPELPAARYGLSFRKQQCALDWPAVRRHFDLDALTLTPSLPALVKLFLEILKFLEDSFVYTQRVKA